MKLHCIPITAWISPDAEGGKLLPRTDVDRFRESLLCAITKLLGTFQCPNWDDMRW
jgi:hypothetical protein